MKILKPPLLENANYHYKNLVLEHDSICPFCKAKNFSMFYRSWYGVKNERETVCEFIKGMFTDKYYDHWKKSIFMCTKCGAEWESDPYIDD